MICFPDAKINLGLHVVRKRAGGYHDIETIFYPVPLCDALEVVASAADGFHQSGIPVDGKPEDNLALKALHLLRKYYPVPPVNIYLHKCIPAGAGLGGGSSDAAFMLGLLNEFAGLGLPEERLEELAAQLGSDCPFFIRNRAVYACGRGEEMADISLSLKGWYLVLVKPAIAVSTARAYGMVTPKEPAVSLKEVVKRPVAEWRGLLVNDFEETITREYPLISAIRDKLYGAGAVYAAMSGSGSAVFGLFGEPQQLQPLFPEHFVWCGELT